MNEAEPDATSVVHTTATGVGLDASGNAPATGVAYTGDYPSNYRMRAEALARDGHETDPGGILTPEAISEAADRLAVEKAEADAQAARERKETPSIRWTLDRLTKEAGVRGVPVNEDMDKGAILAAIIAAPAAPTTEG